MNNVFKNTLTERSDKGAAGGKPVVVISGVNLVEGGTLTTFREMVRAAVAHQPAWRVIALVHKAGILGIPGVTEVPFENIKRSWLRRLVFEWFDLNKLCKQFQADVWISMHDITPRVDAARQFVYCHNPGPFSNLPLRQTLKDFRFALFSAFYGHLYGLNIRRNTAIIVQQQWLRDDFFRRYPVREVIVAHPTGIPPDAARARPVAERPAIFLFPTLPRVFKNIELIGQALRRLESDPRWQARVVVTIDGSENNYANDLLRLFGDLRSLEFIGRQTTSEMDACYARADALLFPSLLETWGLPLSEAKARGLPIVAANLPYAHESVGDYDRVRFFEPADPDALAGLLLDLHLGMSAFESHRANPPVEPFAAGWEQLASMLLQPPVRASAPREKTAARGRFSSFPFGSLSRGSGSGPVDQQHADTVGGP